VRCLFVSLNVVALAIVIVVVVVEVVVVVVVLGGLTVLAVCALPTLRFGLF